MFDEDGLAGRFESAYWGRIYLPVNQDALLNDSFLGRLVYGMSKMNKTV